ncbi:MAG: hypothetical protein ACP5VF_13500 [Acidobacteriota bacterium]
MIRPLGIFGGRLDDPTFHGPVLARLCSILPSFWTWELCQFHPELDELLTKENEARWLTAYGTFCLHAALGRLEASGLPADQTEQLMRSTIEAAEEIAPSSSARVRDFAHFWEERRAQRKTQAEVAGEYLFSQAFQRPPSAEHAELCASLVSLPNMAFHFWFKGSLTEEEGALEKAPPAERREPGHEEAASAGLPGEPEGRASGPDSPATMKVYDPETRTVSEAETEKVMASRIPIQMVGLEGTYWADPSKLTPGTPKNWFFSPKTRAAIQEIKTALDEVQPMSLEEWEVGFRRDANPQSEIALWQVLVGVYRDLVEPLKLSLERRRDYYRVLATCIMSPHETELGRTHVIERERLLREAGWSTLSADEVRMIVDAFYIRIWRKYEMRYS